MAAHMKRKGKVVVKTPSRRDVFVRQLAEFLAGDQGGKSIALELEMRGPPRVIQWAREWSRLRGATPLFGYPTVEEAEAELKRFLFGE